MAEADEMPMIGVEKCGCITLAHSRPSVMDLEWSREVGDLIARGGHVERVSAAEAQKRTEFLPSECPHDPRGWERER